MHIFQLNGKTSTGFMTLVKTNIKKANLPIFLPVLASILGTLYIFRSTFFPPHNLPGDLGDARAVISYVNHWPNFFRGNIGLTDTNYFWPLKDGIGGTDILLLNGLLAFGFQSIGVGLVHSVISTFVLTTFFGLIGAFKVFYRRTQSQLYAFLLTVAVSMSYSLNAQLGHLQLLSTLLIFWVIFFFMPRKKGSQNFSEPRFSLGVLSWLILFLTSWYAAFFLLLTSSIYFLWLLASQTRFENSKQLRMFLSIQNFKWKTSYYFLIPSNLLLVFFSLYVYLPKLFSGQARWPWTEVMLYAPRLGDLINTSTGHQGWIKQFNEFFYLNGFPTYERAMGLVPLLFIFVLIISISIFARPMHTSRELRITCLTLVSILFLPIVDEFGRSPWWFVWQIFPGASGIRSSARIWILASWLALYLLVLYFREIKSIFHSKSVMSILIILISILSIRESQSFWKSENYVSNNSKEVVSYINARDCKAFFLVPMRNGREIPLIQYEAMAISELTGIPTLNGSSARNPNNYILQLADEESAPELVKKWIEMNNAGTSNLDICIFTD